MHITRRAFLRYAVATAASIGLGDDVLSRAETVLAQATLPPVLWLSGSGCTGCSVSLLNSVSPSVDGLLTTGVALRYHSTLMAAAGELAVASATSTAQAGGYVLVVEGAIPTALGGRCCYVWDEGGTPVTMAEAVSSLAAGASQVVAVGTCAAFGGIPAAYAGTAAQGVGSFLGRSVVNLPGCPAHPDWIIGGLTALLAGSPVALDGYGRPTALYPTQPIHERCPRREHGEASRFGQPGLCLEELGCRGPEAHADCDLRRWNNGRNWCIGADGLCIGCTEATFPRFPLHGGGD